MVFFADMDKTGHFLSGTSLLSFVSSTYFYFYFPLFLNNGNVKCEDGERKEEGKEE